MTNPPAAPWQADVAAMRQANCQSFLFLCVANSARSQLAEAIARHLAPVGTVIASAGSCPTTVHQSALAVLAQRNVVTDGLESKDVETLFGRSFHAVITLCAQENCPLWLGDAMRFHWPLPDPARVPGQNSATFETVRDELWTRLAVLFETKE